MVILAEAGTRANMEFAHTESRHFVRINSMLTLPRVTPNEFPGRTWGVRPEEGVTRLFFRG